MGSISVPRGSLLLLTSYTCRKRVIEDLLVKVDKFYFPIDFIVRMYGFKLEGGEWFKGGFRKLFKIEWNSLQET